MKKNVPIYSVGTLVALALTFSATVSAAPKTVSLLNHPV